MLKRVIILGLVPLAASLVASMIVMWVVAELGSEVLGLIVRIKHPGDPSIFDTVSWMIIFTAPLWATVLLGVGMIAGIFTFSFVRRRLSGASPAKSS
jgi:hypothetical protein